MRKLISISSTVMFIVMAGAAFAASSGEKEVLAAMEHLKEAMLKKDRAALEKIFHPWCCCPFSSVTLCVAKISPSRANVN